MNRDEMIENLVANFAAWPLSMAQTYHINLDGGWYIYTSTDNEEILFRNDRIIEVIDERLWEAARGYADARMNNIVRNSNDGDHYEDQSVENSGGFEQNENYKQNDGGDLIDRWAIKYTRTEFRAVMRAQVEKYYDRYGDKDSFVSESRKAADYALRLHEYEVKWAAEDNEVVGDE